MKKILFLITLALSAQQSLASLEAPEAPVKQDPFARYKDNPYLLATAKLFAICNGGVFDEKTFHNTIKFEFSSKDLGVRQLKQGIQVMAFFEAQKETTDMRQSSVHIATTFGEFTFESNAPPMEDIEKAAQKANIQLENKNPHKKRLDALPKIRLDRYNVIHIDGTALPEPSSFDDLKESRDLLASIPTAAREQWNNLTTPQLHKTYECMKNATCYLGLTFTKMPVLAQFLRHSNT